MSASVPLLILILEDNQERIKQFKEAARQNDALLTVCKQNDEMIRTLQRGGYDAVFIDYDLNDKAMLPRDHPESSSETLRWAASIGEEHRRKIAKHWFVHSLNQEGAEYANDLISEIRRAPWAWQPQNFERLMKAIRP